METWNRSEITPQEGLIAREPERFRALSANKRTRDSPVGVAVTRLRAESRTGSEAGALRAGSGAERAQVGGSLPRNGESTG